MNLITAVLLVTVTAYQAKESQTDSTPKWTSIDHHVHTFGVAVSQDLLANGKVCYGDVVIIPQLGLRIVNDTMNKRHRNSIDVFVDTKEQEKRVGIRHVSISILKSEKRYCSRKEYFKSKKP